MRGKCWVCSRQARGLGHTDNRHPIGDAKRYPLDWVFCSRRCQDIFHQMYGRWVDAQKFGQEVEMIDATDIERSAMRSCLRAFGEEVVTRLCQQLLEAGAPGLHFYTLNQSGPTLKLWHNLNL